MNELAAERCQVAWERRPVKPARGDDHTVERLAIDLPTARKIFHWGLEPDPIEYSEPAAVRVQIRMDLLRTRIQSHVRDHRKIRERSHRTTRVGVHPRPHTARLGGRVSLIAEIAVGLEHRRVESRLDRVLGGCQTAKYGTDYCYATSRWQRHGARLLPARSKARSDLTSALSPAAQARRHAVSVETDRRAPLASARNPSSLWSPLRRLKAEPV